MAKENKKVNNVIIICSSKGGEGKSLLSMQKIPLLYLDKNICIFEVDNNNNSKKMQQRKASKLKWIQSRWKFGRSNEGLIQTFDGLSIYSSGNIGGTTRQRCTAIDH